ncbi:hypothetical protein [Pantoea brenneri]|uniref:hypothetical protein n=1 Tax=Pantoea brenneri TaxID=472694 RepID=UPI00132FB646|nr:hypothetical protein [Pantoea brenneri]
MSNPLTIGVSPLTNTIFAGRSKAVRGMAPDARQFIGPKEDVPVRCFTPLLCI